MALNEDEPMLPTVVVPGEGVRSLALSPDAERDRAASILLGADRGEGVLLHIRRMAEQPQRSSQWATLYAEIVGWRGTKAQVLAWIMAQLGCGLERAQEAVRELDRVPQDPHEIAAMCRDYLDWYGKQYPAAGNVNGKAVKG